MTRYFRRFFALILCSVGLLLPWRARVVYSEFLGWIVQFVYMNYVYILKLILRQLEKR